MPCFSQCNPGHVWVDNPVCSLTGNQCAGRGEFPRLSGQNLRAVQLQIRYIGKLLPGGLKTWLKSFFSFFKVLFSTSFRNVSCLKISTATRKMGHASLPQARLEKKKKPGKCVLFKWLLYMSLDAVCCCCLVCELCPTLCNPKARQAPLSLEFSRQEC